MIWRQSKKPANNLNIYKLVWTISHECKVDFCCPVHHFYFSPLQHWCLVLFTTGIFSYRLMKEVSAGWWRGQFSDAEVKQSRVVTFAISQCHEYLQPALTRSNKGVKKKQEKRGELQVTCWLKGFSDYCVTGRRESLPPLPSERDSRQALIVLTRSTVLSLTHALQTSR